jgi:hypothetical protein
MVRSLPYSILVSLDKCGYRSRRRRFAARSDSILSRLPTPDAGSHDAFPARVGETYRKLSVERGPIGYVRAKSNKASTLV